jgi:phage tail sheath gpL-like
MSGTLVLTIDCTKFDPTPYVDVASRSREGLTKLSNLMAEVAGGNKAASVLLTAGSAAPVQASGTATLIYADLIATDTITIAGITLTCVTGTPSSVQFKKETDLATTAANLAAAINALSTLNIYVSATASAGVVTITAKQAGVIGNLITLAKSVTTPTAITLSGTNLASGAGGATGASVTYNKL